MTREEQIAGLMKIAGFFEARADMAVGDAKMLLLNWMKCAEEAAEGLREQEPMTEQEHKDLEILRKVRSGAILKSVSHDCVIYNGNWYRKNPWNQPRETRVLSLEEYRAIAERPLEERVPVWLEWRGGRGRWAIPERAYQGYGVNWHCWTGKPSNEQRRAETWT